jgi:hypothetical protein
VVVLSLASESPENRIELGKAGACAAVVAAVGAFFESNVDIAQQVSNRECIVTACCACCV